MYINILKFNKIAKTLIKINVKTVIATIFVIFFSIINPAYTPVYISRFLEAEACLDMYEICLGCSNAQS